MMVDMEVIPLDHRQAFDKWVKELRTHHECAELVELLAKLPQNPPGDMNVELTIIWNAWRAATWKASDNDRSEALAELMFPKAAEELLALASAIDDGGRLGTKFSQVAGFSADQVRAWAEALSAGAAAVRSAMSGDTLLQPFHHGPFVFSKPINGKRKPERATMLAAQIALILKTCGVARTNWKLISKLTAVAGFGSNTDAATLRVSARRLIGDCEHGRVALIGWPQDIPYLTMGELRTSRTLSEILHAPPQP
jgi:hypothetical protein